jgi:uncharacterized DUF497 family protein
MAGITFEWDRAKDSANRWKHGVGFDQASTVFGDPFSITIPDPDHSIDEERLVIVGMSDKRALLIVVHTIRGERLRLISARSATSYEKRHYEESSV